MRILSNHRDYVAVIWGRIAGMSGAIILDVFAANNLHTLTAMVRARGLTDGEFVRYDRNAVFS